MSDDIIVLARRHKHIASHYEGCEADHIGCLVNKLADEVEGLREEIEKLSAVDAALKQYLPQTREWMLAQIALMRLEGKP